MRSKAKSTTSHLDQNVEVANNSENVTLRWLENNAGPFCDVLKAWQNTRNERKLILKSTISSYEYLEKYPGLGTTDGFKLVSCSILHSQIPKHFLF